MTLITLRVLDGADRGRIFENLSPPISIGREEGNTIQLNDERVSRFHLKIQQDHGDIVLTDLESTNGTKVNNEEVQLRILRHGDLITVGRSTMLFGTREEINRRLERLAKSEYGRKMEARRPDANDLDLEQAWAADPNYQLALLDIDPPRLPDRLSPGQAAQLSELLEYLHMHFRRVINDAEFKAHHNRVEISAEQWQRILDLQCRLAEYLRGIGEPAE